ncbi:Peroxiredoxin [Roseomonas mucosa]|uniref:Alkyl hydroperoxide reductase C n=1 Tax=Roseomonas mucosa TaxID=207340 RepID=A0A379N1Q4_9PROT|nr:MULTISPECIES: peroxiredoxin [Roseomonas]MBS5903421.1 peroxiredoxin [Acetobacteraceae bacterium]MDT8265160.1 peroxiredoxin [Roseomonas sp. DSM 102946]ATR20829.1 peroxiredoxin [Roseomonas sp. FDAARGOS_362]AWV22635.1 Peroxiredoxin [Roseomonas mucosa]MCG7350372.1 peroxiredoxin [Roseomonas mucosa]
MLQLGQVAPDFEAETTQGRIRFHDWLGGSWGVLFSHPKDFTPVCTTELGMTARLKPEFEKRGVKVIGLSVDTLDRHAGWDADIAETQGVAVNFPMISDPDRTVANLYGMIHPEADPSVTVRTVFVIDPNRKIRLMLVYPPSAGRNFDEVLRVIDSLQTTDRHKVATPVNWQPGDRAIVLASLSDEQAKQQFPQGFTTEKPYLRWVELPKE